ncbi:hypothetical protein DAEQUDRAFT_371345 [Daedalea quercina L-15889]|uniref:Uncharacterized protein n=1 Tax=Daedalea quercina L-15889 TaxID=1314783 RepID=A0A165P5Z4_9APHY|nr:hypothetical protein DAEQUDRAFT_371345 [Daedalea quercina L-15889]
MLLKGGHSTCYWYVSANLACDRQRRLPRSFLVDWSTDAASPGQCWCCWSSCNGERPALQPQRWSSVSPLHQLSWTSRQLRHPSIRILRGPIRLSYRHVIRRFGVTLGTPCISSSSLSSSSAMHATDGGLEDTSVRASRTVRKYVSNAPLSIGWVSSIGVSQHLERFYSSV